MTGMKLRVSEKKKKDLFFIVLFLLPSILVLGGTIFLPLATSISLSFQRNILIDPNRNAFLGIGNYVKALISQAFWSSTGKSLLFVGASVFVAFLIGLSLALLLHKRMKFRGFLRGVGLLPWVIPPVATALMWVWMYQPHYGILNELLVRLGIIAEYGDWLGNPRTALLSVVIVNIWGVTPFFMIMLLAGLQPIPVQLYEASRVDGASKLQEFWYITLPLLRPTILVATLLQIIWQMRNFSLIWIMTEGGPLDATQTLVVHVYRQAFRLYRFGYGSALGVMLSMISLAIAVLYLRVFARK